MEAARSALIAGIAICGLAVVVLSFWPWITFETSNPSFTDSGEIILPPVSQSLSGLDISRSRDIESVEPAEAHHDEGWCSCEATIGDGYFTAALGLLLIASAGIGRLGGRPTLGGGIATIAFTFVAYLPGWLFDTDLWIRVQAAKDDAAARRGLALAGINAFLFVGLLPMLIGVAALGLFPLESGLYPAAVGFEGDAIFAALVAGYAPGWLAGLVAVGLVAAAMSTIDTCANVVALSVAYDLLEVNRRRSSRQWSRVTTAGAVAAACIFALNTDSLWDIFYLSSGVLTAAVAFPVAAVFLPGVNPRGLVWSSRAGLVGIVLAYFLETRGFLAAWEPAGLAATGLGFILWGILAAAIGYLLGTLYK